PDCPVGAVILAMDANHSRITIFSDSKSAIEAICNCKHYQRNYIIYLIKQAVLSMAKAQISVTLYWVPSHEGIPGNETADCIAKNAATNGVLANFKIPFEDFFCEATKAADLRFNNYLKTRAQTKGTVHFERYPLTSKKTWFHEYSLTREEITIINRLRSNHYNLNESLHRVNIIDSPDCTCGPIRQTINHVIFECPLFEHKALPLRRYLSQDTSSPPVDIFPFLSKPPLKLIRLLLAFMKALSLSL
ncbi:hypothetical protein ALC57_05124, partial [Trachymyrmex cornetzi]